eukprot:CAMPEP_0116873956 /NCGR_PEP_ID=MMETSP0463-20121206/5311_1 /TAXON_ID=181622 /ORGANISM="Strombidinopsis sp, Strain SopsisLIS2011" /LENGTH=34 /DNA_ID= /DNA_START= /DNA_END= /DNA_ORIENTATION=
MGTATPPPPMPAILLRAMIMANTNSPMISFDKIG